MTNVNKHILGFPYPLVIVTLCELEAKAHRMLVEFSIHGDFPSFFVCLPEAKNSNIHSPSIYWGTKIYRNLHFPMVFLWFSEGLDVGAQVVRGVHATGRTRGLRGKPSMNLWAIFHSIYQWEFSGS